MQAMKHTCEGINPGFETHGRRHQKSKTRVSVAPQKIKNTLLIRTDVSVSTVVVEHGPLDVHTVGLLRGRHAAVTVLEDRCRSQPALPPRTLPLLLLRARLVCGAQR